MTIKSINSKRRVRRFRPLSWPGNDFHHRVMVKYGLLRRPLFLPLLIMSKSAKSMVHHLTHIHRMEITHRTLNLQLFLAMGLDRPQNFKNLNPVALDPILQKIYRETILRHSVSNKEQVGSVSRQSAPVLAGNPRSLLFSQFIYALSSHYYLGHRGTHPLHSDPGAKIQASQSKERASTEGFYLKKISMDSPFWIHPVALVHDLYQVATLSYSRRQRPTQPPAKDFFDGYLYVPSFNKRISQEEAAGRSIARQALKRSGDRRMAAGWRGNNAGAWVDTHPSLLTHDVPFSQSKPFDPKGNRHEAGSFPMGSFSMDKGPGLNLRKSRKETLIQRSINLQKSSAGHRNQNRVIIGNVSETHQSRIGSADFGPRSLHRLPLSLLKTVVPKSFRHQSHPAAAMGSKAEAPLDWGEADEALLFKKGESFTDHPDLTEPLQGQNNSLSDLTPSVRAGRAKLNLLNQLFSGVTRPGSDLPVPQTIFSRNLAHTGAMQSPFSEGRALFSSQSSPLSKVLFKAQSLQGKVPDLKKTESLPHTIRQSENVHRESLIPRKTPKFQETGVQEKKSIPVEHTETLSQTLSMPSLNEGQTPSIKSQEISAIADKVYKILEKKLYIEKERRGLLKW